MKTVKKDVPVKKLPPHHVAVLFEGPWLMTQDPDDPTRVLAMCPYTNDPDHICQRGLWDHHTDALVGMTLKKGLPDDQGKPGFVREGERFWIDVAGRRGGTQPESVTKLFEQAATGCQDYPLVYFRDEANKVVMEINHSDPLMRRVSIAMPDFLIPAGRITNASVKTGTRLGAVNPKQYLFQAAPTTDYCSYVAFAFVYHLRGTGTLAMNSPSLPPSAPISVKVSPTYNPHLIFRVHGGQVATPDGLPSDISAENHHIVGSFDLLRKLVTKPSDTSPGGGSDAGHIDVGIYLSPEPVATPEYDPNFTQAEIGVAREGRGAPRPQPIYKDLSSCATGPIVG